MQTLNLPTDQPMDQRTDTPSCRDFEDASKKEKNEKRKPNEKRRTKRMTYGKQRAELNLEEKREISNRGEREKGSK